MVKNLPSNIGLDLIDRVPDGLWNEVCDIVQETGIKTIPIEKIGQEGNTFVSLVQHFLLLEYSQEEGTNKFLE